MVSRLNDVHMLRLRAEGLVKHYDLHPVIPDVSFQLSEGDVLGIRGANGSGKSTLLKCLGNVVETTSGSIEWSIDNAVLKEEEFPRHVGFVAPYLQLYTEYTPNELLTLLGKMRGCPLDRAYADQLFQRFNLDNRADDLLRTFSSGMLQRVKFIVALSHHPSFLLLDEPTTNLDEAGIGVVHELIEERKGRRITVIATNDPQDYRLCSHTIDL